MAATRTPPFTKHSQNGLLVKITDYHEHAEGAVYGGNGVPRKWCWPQHRTKPEHIIACEAFVQFKMQTPRNPMTGKWLWVVENITRTVQLFTPHFCGQIVEERTESWAIKDGVTEKDPRNFFWTYGAYCGTKTPEVC